MLTQNKSLVCEQASPIQNLTLNLDAAQMGFLLLTDGVYYVDDKGRHRICSPLTIKAWVRDNASENWGRLLEFCDADGYLHRLVIPMDMLKGNGDEVKGLLSSQADSVGNLVN